MLGTIVFCRLTQKGPCGMTVNNDIDEHSNSHRSLRLLSQSENKVFRSLPSYEDKDFRSMSRCENNGFSSQWLGHDALLVVVVRGPGRRSFPPVI